MNLRLLKRRYLVVIACVFTLPAFVYAQITAYQEKQWLETPAASSHIGNLTGDAHAAAGPYRRYCVGCHGDLGDGNGGNDPWLDPKPRDSTAGVFKCRSTPTGTLPTDEDIYNSIERGLDRSNMPTWNTFTSQMRADLVAWIKHRSEEHT